MYENFVKPIEYFAATIADGVVELLGNKSSELSNAPSDGRVTLPADLFAKPDVQTEWWYYTGHCSTVSGRQFGFELVFFKRRTDRDNFGVVPVALIANPMYFAHFAISDVTAGTFRYEHERSFGNAFELPVKMSETACDVGLGEWSLREVAGRHVLHATLKDGTVFDAILEPSKPLVLNGEDGSGIAKKSGGSSVHFSYTRMAVTGQMTVYGEVERFTGAAWMDREFGAWEQGGWDWFSIQFDDDTELMIYQFKTPEGEMGDSTGTFVRADGSCEYLKRSDFEINVTSRWTSPHTGAEYPSRWHVRVERLAIDIEIEALIADQELDTRGSTMVVYWEGVCSVSGTRAESNVGGRAYVELVGYDRSHETAGISDFFFGRQIRQLREMFG